LVGFTDIYRQITMKMTTRSFVSGVALGSATLAMAFGSVDRAQAATLLNDNFNTENGGVTGNSSLNYTGFANWDVTGGTVDLIGNGFAEIASGNGISVDLNGSVSGAISTKSSFTFTSGQSATLSFLYGTNNDGGTGTSNSAKVFLGGQEIGTIASSPLNAFTPVTFNILNPTSGVLSFQSDNLGPWGIAIDNVLLVSNDATSVPEPSDFVGTAFAFGSVVLLKRKMTKKNLG
jgi:hypothetical protein